MQRVLIIDDEPEVREVHRRCVRHVGADPVVVPTGSQGRDAAIHEAFDAVIIDLKLPDGNGMDFCDAIWAARPDQAILVVSGSAYEDDARLRRATGVLLKPFEIPLLVDTLNQILSAKAEGRPVQQFGFLNPTVE